MSNKTCMSLNINRIKIIALLGLVFLLSNCSQSIPALMYTTKDLTYAYSNEIHINYEKLGYGDKKVVFLHGFGTSLHSWDDIKELFPLDEFTLYLIDLKGFGNSSKPEDDKYTIEDQSKIVKQFVEDINTDSLYLIGHSYGGAVALLTQISLLNEMSKTRISKLILIDCLAYTQEMPAFIEYLRTPLLDKLTFQLRNKSRAEYILDKILYDKSKATKKLIDRYASYYYGEGLEYTFIKSSEQIDPDGYGKIISAYKNIPTPCLILWGNNDSVLTVNNGIRLSKELPHTKLEIIDSCGHTPQEEKPEITFEKMYSFIRGN